jgi:hypothetical protein
VVRSRSQTEVMIWSALRAIPWHRWGICSYGASQGTEVVIIRGTNCWSRSPKRPVAMVRPKTTHRACSSGPPQWNPLWQRMSTTLSRPSQMCPFSHSLRGPSHHHDGTLRSADSSPA